MEMDMKAISHYWPNNYLFLLTHADWCVPTLAALLTHQLGVRGVGCSGLKYEHPSDLLRLRWLIARNDRTVPRGRFLFDALVNNEQHLPRQFSDSARLRALICIQRPIETLLSMVKGGIAMSLSKAEYLYRDRLEWLAGAGQYLGERALVFPAECVSEQPNTLIGAIALHLGMERDFKPVPQSLLEDDEATVPRVPPIVEIDARIQDRCEESYHDALLELSRTCLTLGITGGIWDPSSWDSMARGQQPNAETASPGALEPTINQSRVAEGALQ